MVSYLLLQGRDLALRLRRSVFGHPLARHVTALTAANGVKASLSFVQGILVARWLGPELYGVAALVMSVPSLVYMFFDTRSSEASIKYLSEFHVRGERSRAAAMCLLGYSVDLATAIVVLLFVAAIAPWASQAVVHRPELAWLLILYAAAFLFRSLQNTSYAILAVHRHFPTIAVMGMAFTVARVILVLGLVVAGWGVYGVVIGNALAMVLRGVVYAAVAWPLMRRSWGGVGLRGAWRLLRGRRREIMSFLAFNDISALLGIIPKQFDIVLLGYLADSTSVGIYKLGKRMGSVIVYVVNPLQSVVYPSLSANVVYAGTHALRQKIRAYTYKLGVPVFVACILAASVVGPLIEFAVGTAYAESVLVAQVLFIAYASWCLFFWLRPVYMAKGMTKQWAMGFLYYSSAFMIVSLVLSPFWGPVGVAIAHLVVMWTFHIGMSAWFYASV